MVKARTYILVTIVAVLVWLFAEGESLRVYQSEVDVSLESGSESRLLEVVEGQGWTGRVRVHLEGSAANIDTLRDRLTQAVRLSAAAGQIEVEEGREQPVDLREALRRSNPFEASGVTIKQVEPRSVMIILDRLVERPARVRVITPDRAGDAEVRAIPAQANLRIPSRLIDALPPEPEVVARLPAEAVAGAVPGQATRVGAVPLSLPESLAALRGVELRPRTVAVEFTLRTATAWRTIDSVPVHIREPVEFRDHYRIELADRSDAFLTNVNVSGPAALVNQIGAGGVQPIAEIELLPGAIEQALAEADPAEMLQRPRIIGLPPGVTVSEQMPLIRLRVSRRAEPSDS